MAPPIAIVTGRCSKCAARLFEDDAALVAHESAIGTGVKLLSRAELLAAERDAQRSARPRTIKWILCGSFLLALGGVSGMAEECAGCAARSVMDAVCGADPSCSRNRGWMLGDCRMGSSFERREALSSLFCRDYTARFCRRHGKLLSMRWAGCERSLPRNAAKMRARRERRSGRSSNTAIWRSTVMTVSGSGVCWEGH